MIQAKDKMPVVEKKLSERLRGAGFLGKNYPRSSKEKTGQRVQNAEKAGKTRLKTAQEQFQIIHQGQKEDCSRSRINTNFFKFKNEKQEEYRERKGSGEGLLLVSTLMEEITQGKMAQSKDGNILDGTRP